MPRYLRTTYERREAPAELAGAVMFPRLYGDRPVVPRRGFSGFTISSRIRPWGSAHRTKKSADSRLRAGYTSATEEIQRPARGVGAKDSHVATPPPLIPTMRSGDDVNYYYAREAFGDTVGTAVGGPLGGRIVDWG